MIAATTAKQPATEPLSTTHRKEVIGSGQVSNI
jgi:hypothetical protein